MREALLEIFKSKIEFIQDENLSGDYIAEIPDTISTIMKLGVTSAHTALMCKDISEKYQLPRGLFTDLIGLYYKPISGTREIHYENVNKYVRDTINKAVNESLYTKQQRKYVKKVKAYATLPELFNSKDVHQMPIYAMIIDSPMSIMEIRQFVEDNGMVFSDKKFNKFCRGYYVKYGWLVVSVHSKLALKYKLVPVGWDGEEIPSGCVDLTTYRTYK